MRKSHSNIIINSLFAFLFFSLIGNPLSTFPQSRENLLKAGYIEKFTHFIEWPGTSDIDNPSASFTIAVFGKDEFENALEQIFSKVLIKNKHVRIKYISSTGEIGNSLILIVSKSEKNRIDDITKYTSGKPILTIGDAKGLCEKGIMINLIIDNNHLRYEINSNTVNKSGLKVSSLLLNSATIVNSNE